MLTSSVVAAVWPMLPDVPVIVSDSAYGDVLAVVFMVSIDEPAPTIEAGLNPPLVMPVGNPGSLSTFKLTVPVKPLIGKTVTVKVADCPGTTSPADGVTAIEKSGVGGVTVIVLVGGSGSEFPVPSITVSDAT